MPLSKEVLDQIVETVAVFARDKLIPLEQQVDRTGLMPDDIIKSMRELGLFGMTIPEKYGGLGLSISEEIAVIFELAQAAPAFRSVIGTNNGIGSQAIVKYGRPDQRELYLPRLAQGAIIGSFALTEPDAGSDAASIKTTAQRRGDSYVLNGTKRFITNAPVAGLFTVFARTYDELRKDHGISAFLVERSVPGIRIGPTDVKMGQHGSATADVMFDDCVVPATALLGECPGEGFKQAMSTLNRGRLHIAAVCVGLAQRLQQEAFEYAAARRQFGKPIVQHQLVQAMLADSEAEILAARSMVTATAQLADTGGQYAKDAACCKMFCSEMVGRVADRAVQIHGGAGYIRDSAVERLYRDVRLFRIYEGTTQIQQLTIAREMIRTLS